MDSLRRKPKITPRGTAQSNVRFVSPKKTTTYRSLHPAHASTKKEYTIQQLGVCQTSHELPYCPKASYMDDAVYAELLAQRSLRKIAQNDTDQISLDRSSHSREDEDIPHDNTDELSLRLIMNPGDRGKRIGISSMKNTFVFVSMLSLALVIVGATHLVGTLFSVKGNVMGVSQDGYYDLTSAVKSMSERDFNASQRSLESAESSFSLAVEEMNRINQGITELSQYIPGASQLYSAEQLLSASLHLTRAGESLNSAIIPFDDRFTSDSDHQEENHISLLDLYTQAHNEFVIIEEELSSAQKNVNNVVVADLPEEHRATFMMIKQQLPQLIAMSQGFTQSNEMIVDLLGGNGPRKYLFLFQNNQEMRATGGFIGSYGLLDLKEGEVRNFFIEGIYNPDGQLTDKIVPPRPIQKISARWSLHDSNWFADFPTSAQKAMLFYEKTGGATVDGVVAITPTLLENLIDIVGPIDMPAYDTTITAENFIQQTRDEIKEVDDDNKAKIKKSEVDSDTKLSSIDDQSLDEADIQEPKQILADLAPLILEKIMSPQDLDTTTKIFSAIHKSMQEKHILLYASNAEAQEVITQQQWGGTLTSDARDYLSVVNTNINGFKTDGVIDESIVHDVQIGEDGTVIDTVSITRTHNGGYTDYEWWDAVNANYMRLFVPQGSQLLSVEGQTREFNEPALDYNALGFDRDPDIVAEEENMIIDEESGTRIYQQNDKTVFANWVYVSPQESVTITYQYRLPWQIILDDQKREGQFAAYDVLYQKQHGSVGSDLNTTVQYPSVMQTAWTNMTQESTGQLDLKTTLTTDHYAAAAFHLGN